MGINEKDLVRESIVKAASKVFGKYGFKKATMDDIGQAIKKGKTAVYYYFPSKEDIFKAVIEREAEILGQSIFTSISKEDDPIKKLKIYIIARMKSLKKLTNFYDAMKSELLDHLVFLDEVRQNSDKFEVSLLTNILNEGNSKKMFSVKKPEKTAEIIVTILKGLEIPIFLKSDLSDLEERTESIIDLIVYGLANKK